MRLHSVHSAVTRELGLYCWCRFREILEKHEAEMKARGEADAGDFWSSLDADSDGFIDRTEADLFFKQMYATLLSSQKNKDEV